MPTTAAAAGATLLAVAFGASTLERWLVSRRRHHLAWSIALGMFAVAAGALWWGASSGWTPTAFRLFYLFGAIVNVPVLALGTVYLLGGTHRGDRVALGVSALTMFSFGVLAVAPMDPIADPGSLPRGSELFGVLPRLLAAVASSVGALVILGGCALTVWRGVRGRLPSLSARRLVTANLLLAGGTVVLSAGGLLNSVVDEMTGFAVSLVVGAGLLFAGFLTAPQRT